MVKTNQNLFLHFQQIRMGVIEWDKNFYITDWNPAAEEIFGHTKDEALGERIKELRCLYNLSSLEDRRDSSEDEILSETVVFIPPGWQYPEITCVRIILDGREFRTDNFLETEWKQRGEISIYGDIHGALEIFYLEEKPNASEGPFLEEERNLIDELCDRLGKMIEHKRAEKFLRESEEQYRGMFNNNHSVMLIIDPENTKIVDANSAALAFYGWDYAELTSKKVSGTYKALQ